MSENINILQEKVQAESSVLSDSLLELLYQYFKARYNEETYGKEAVNRLKEDEEFQQIISSMCKKLLFRYQ